MMFADFGEDKTVVSNRRGKLVILTGAELTLA